MKLIWPIIFLLLSTLSANSFARDEVAPSATYQIVGKFVKPSAKLNLPYKYYFVFSNSKKQQVAYPIENKSSLDMSKIDYSQIYHINVVDTEKVVNIGETKKEVKVLEIVEGKVFNFKDLSYAANQKPKLIDDEPTPNIPNENSPHHPMFRINDNVANAAIFTAGAILLGSMLLGK